ncbi:ShK domain-like family protein [Acanthocheilonema viteae]
MNAQDILGTKLLINIIFACAILYHTVAKRMCINGECKSDGIDDCYQNQCYEVLGDCNEENQCEYDNSICVRTENKTNICVWLKLREGDVTASITDVTASTTDVTASTTDVTASTTATSHTTDVTASTTATSHSTDITAPTTTATSLITDITIPTTITTTTSLPPITTPHDKCGDKIPTCLRYYFLCNNNLYKELMKSLCYLTCGYCNKTVLTTITPDICQDKAAPGKPSDCPLHYDLCYNSVYAELMKDQCPKTCGFCSVQHQ